MAAAKKKKKPAPKAAPASKKKPAPKKKKKKPASPKRKPVKAAAVKQRGQMVAVSSVLPFDAEIDDTNLDTLRRWACQYYTLSVNQVSLSEMSKTPPFSRVPKRTLEKWSSDDGWVSKRREAQERIRQIVEQQLGNEIAQERMNQLKELQRVYDEGIRQLTDETEGGRLRANSFEGAVGAVVRLADLMDTWREKLARQVGGVIESTEAGAGDGDDRVYTPAPKLSVDEARSVVKEILRMRRDSIDQGE